MNIRRFSIDFLNLLNTLRTTMAIRPDSSSRMAGKQRIRILSVRAGVASILCAVTLAACGSSDETGAAIQSSQTRQASFPGAAPWEKVPRDRVKAECGLDPDLLDAAEAAGLGNSPHVIIRYGKLCWSGGDPTQAMTPSNFNSVTKSFAALTFGVIAGRTDADESDLFTDWRPLSDYLRDPLSALLLNFPPLNPNAQIFHVLTQTGHNPNLAYGGRLPWTYDALGIRGMNALVQLMDNVVEANPEQFPGSTSALDVAKNELWAPLGMTTTTWDGIGAAGGLTSTVYEMAKLGELMLRKGRWGDKQIVDEDYIYRMTHPQVEDIHTGYGYLTWLNADQGVATLFGTKVDRECSPFSAWQTYPHAPSFEAPNSNGGSPFENSKYDIGVFWFDGAGGQYVYVHRGLDLVLVIRDDEAAQENDPESQRRGKGNAGGFEYHRIWRYVRPALVAMDPVYRGDEAGFCEAYRSGKYAPDLISAWNSESGFGSVRLDD